MADWFLDLEKCMHFREQHFHRSQGLPAPGLSAVGNSIQGKFQLPIGVRGRPKTFRAIEDAQREINLVRQGHVLISKGVTAVGTEGSETRAFSRISSACRAMYREEGWESFNDDNPDLIEEELVREHGSGRTARKPRCDIFCGYAHDLANFGSDLLPNARNRPVPVSSIAEIAGLPMSALRGVDIGYDSGCDVGHGHRNCSGSTRDGLSRRI